MPQHNSHYKIDAPIHFETQENLEALPHHEHLSIVLILSGTARQFLNEKAVTLTAPCIMLISPYDKVELIESNHLTAESFSFIPVFLDSALTFERLKTNNFTEIADKLARDMISMFLSRDEFYNGVIDLPASTYLTVSEWFKTIQTELFERSDISRVCRIRRYLVQTLYLLHDIYKSGGTPDNENKVKYPIDILLEYIHVDYEKEISLNSLCELVHINRTTLNRKFKEKTGYTVMEYLIRHRVRIACDILSRTQLGLKEVAVTAGFKRDTYLIKQFTAIMGISPTEYRKLMEKNVADGPMRFCRNQRSECEQGYCNVFGGYTGL